ncbi:PAP2 superfamily protein [Tritrichomonas foetus]|uniref:PAP2 superfamily protein n=1 Tax=Tritrichomonas foetus TaxID=1144522 RepID=A0A1J4JF61_9EUKA|nr:PAP2 superfamily protein [Tritrichomonas foetus]|eukprot:OHS97736.1 PAP2 superfamily protein [Tritrichomonas foetus]
MNLKDFLSAFQQFCILDFIVVALCFGSAFYVHNIDHPANFVPFLLSDIDNQLSEEIISDVYIVASTALVGAIVSCCLWITKKVDLSILKVLSSYLFAVAFTDLITAVLQYIVGRPRPDTLALCGSLEECSNVLNPEKMRYQFRSLPSGNSAQSMAGSIFTTFLLCNIWESSSLFSTIFKFSPICFSLFIGSLEITNRTNHVDDVVMGYFIGALVGFITFSTFKSGIENDKDGSSGYTRGGNRHELLSSKRI